MDKRNKKIVVAVGLGVLLLALGFGVARAMREDPASGKRLQLDSATLTTVTTTYDLASQYLGPCAVVTPPTSDPCQAAQGTLRYSFWGSMVNASIFQNWKKANPGEYTRLLAHLATPRCSTGSIGQPQDMITAFGAALYSEAMAYACALGSEAIAMPAPNPPPIAGAKDKKPPSAPGPIQVTP